MFVLKDKTSEVRMIDFGDGKRTLFQLPVLGDDGVPMMLNATVALMVEAFEGGAPSNSKVADLWGTFINVLGANYPKAIEHISQMDTEQFKYVLDHWFSASKSMSGFDPKA